jgi:hypothetical protein
MAGIAPLVPITVVPLSNQVLPSPVLTWSLAVVPEAWPPQGAVRTAESRPPWRRLGREHVSTAVDP